MHVKPKTVSVIEKQILSDNNVLNKHTEGWVATVIAIGELKRHYLQLSVYQMINKFVHLPTFDGGTVSILSWHSLRNVANILNNLSGNFVFAFDKSVLFAMFVKFPPLSISGRVSRRWDVELSPSMIYLLSPS